MSRRDYNGAETARENRIRERVNQAWRERRERELRRREVEALEERNRIERDKLNRGR